MCVCVCVCVGVCVCVCVLYLGVLHELWYAHQHRLHTPQPVLRGGRLNKACVCVFENESVHFVFVCMLVRWVFVGGLRIRGLSSRAVRQQLDIVYSVITDHVFVCLGRREEGRELLGTQGP
jgi:hypothetical protein